MKKTKKPAKKVKVKKPAKRVTPVKEAPASQAEEYSPEDKWDGEPLTEEQQKLHASWLRTLKIGGYTTKDVRAECVGDLSEGGEFYLWDFAIVKKEPKTYLELGHQNQKFNRFVPHGFFLDGHYSTELDPITAECFLIECGYRPAKIKS